MKKGLLIVCVLSCMTVFAQTKKEKIQNMMELTNSANLGIQMASQFIDSFKEAYPDVPEEFWVEIKKEMKPEDLQSMMLPIYDKHFTEGEIDDIIVFYKSPSGKKLIENMPIIFQESQAVGQEWGQSLAKRVMDKIEKKYKYKSPPPPATK